MTNRLTLLAFPGLAALMVAACSDATRPEPADPGSVITVRSTAGPVTFSLEGKARRGGKPSFSGSSSDTPCVGTLIPGVYQNVVVPPGAACVLVGSTILGNLRALQNSTLTARNNDIRGNVELLGVSFVSLQGGNRVAGQIFGEKWTFLIDIVNFGFVGSPNVIRGDIILKEGADVGVCGNTLTDGSILVEKNTGGSLLAGGLRCTQGFGDGNLLEKGNIKFEENLVPPGNNGLQIGDNRVAQNLQVFKNRGLAVKTVTRNTVGQDLQCFENDQPFVGGPNAARQAQGQCFAGLP